MLLTQSNESLISVRQLGSELKKVSNTEKQEEMQRNKKRTRQLRNKQMKTNGATLLINLSKGPTLRKSGKDLRTVKANSYQPSLDKKTSEETESYLSKRQTQ